ncbi:MAG: DUF4340 domain-containing protein [Spirochaetales bacterium]|nr:DUF4340 domain-containing protein [Spirochaetales bacterium]
MKIKKEYIILGVIVIILIGFLIFQNTSNKTHYKLPKINKVEKDDIKKIILTKPDETITLKKENENWRILPGQFPADPAKIDRIVNVVTGFTITDLVSESKNYGLYELDDENKINLKAFSADDRILLEFDIGKKANTYRHTFVKLKDNPNVYHAKEIFQYDVPKTVDEFRDKQVMKFDRSEIYSITLNNNKEELIVNKEMENVDVTDETRPSEIWKSGPGRKVRENEITTMLDTLAGLRCENYIEGKNKADFKNPIYSLIIKGTKDYTISIYKKEDTKYPAISSENDDPFMLSAWKTEKFMKEYEDLFEDEE